MATAASTISFTSASTCGRIIDMSAFAEHQAMIRSGSLKLEYFELADECRARR